MKQATKRFVSMIIVLLFIVGAFVIFFELIRPAYEDAQTIRSEVISRETFVHDQEDAIAQVQQLIQSYQSETGVQESVDRALPGSPDFAGALYQLNGIATGNGIGLSTLSVSAPSLASNRPDPATSSSSASVALVKPVGTVSFQVKLTGRYEDLKAFLADLEDNIRIFDVQSLSVQQAGTKPGVDLYTVDMSITTYYQVK